ncbi:ATP-binding response regulator, partial [Singulisphaera rosea]
MTAHFPREHVPSPTQSEWERIVLLSIVEGVIAADAGGHVTFLNREAEVMTGWSQADSIGRPLAELLRLTEEETGRAVENLSGPRPDEGDSAPTTRRVILQGRDGTERAIELSTTFVNARNGDAAGAVLVFRDLTERRRAEETRALLASIVDSSDDAIVSKTLDGVIRSWNAGAERLFGYAAHEAVGHPITLIIPPDRHNEEPEILRRLQRGERVEHFETVRRTKDGRLIDISLTISPVRDRQGKIIGASKIAHDISARKSTEAAMAALLEQTQTARQEAESANRMKDEFLATLSHELRTPLNAILGWAKILHSGPVDPTDLEDGLSAIERNAVAQAQIIEDILDISRIVSGNFRLEVRPVDIQEVIEAAIAAVTPAAISKGIRLQKVLDSIAGPVSGDFARLQQVVWNLLSNAVKFTPKGGKVKILLERVNSHIEISVIDSGVGIAPDFLPLVFDRFRQADSSTTRRQGGLGLGLSIVKQLVELHGGSVRVKSPGEGQGAHFIVTLPITVVHPRPSGSEKTKPSDSGASVTAVSLAGVSVLVVDDEPDARELLRRALERCGAEVTLASSAPEAMQALGRSHPHVIVSDIGMPDEDGYSFIRKVRSKHSAKDLPAAALTAFARPEERRRALLAGFQIHVTKPVDPAELAA